MPGGFCFSTSNQDSAQAEEPQFVNIAPGADFEQRLEDALLGLDINTGDNDVECIVETTRMSLSPLAYDESLAEEMYCLTLRSIDKAEKILHEVCQGGDLRVSFGIDQDLYNFLIRTYQYIIFRHPITELIEFDNTSIRPTDNWITVSVNQSMMYITAYRQRKLQLANCLDSMVVQNRAYHVLNTWTSLNFDVLKDTLYIIGTETEAKRLRSAVSKFIKQCV